MHLLMIGPLNSQIQEASRIVMERGSKLVQVDTIDRGLDLIRKGQQIDAIMIEASLNVKGLIISLERERICLPVVACGVNHDASVAVKAIKAGAKEYVPLPPDPELIAAVLEAIAEDHRKIIYDDPKMREVIKLAEQVAKSDANILLSGGSGTGKEMMSRHIHQSSKRAGKNFVSLNCAAIPDNLLESELFGHEKGAFTGAVAKRVGKFEQASGGTLLLDEISEMDPRLQAKLLRAIQEKEIERVGGNETVKVDIRIIATTNRDLTKEIKNGNFREDLYFRLNVINLKLPNLSERPKDIDVLATFFAKQFSVANGLAEKSITSQGLVKLKSYSWPGNVRELENTIHRSVILSQGNTIDAQDIHLPQEETKQSSTSQTIEQMNMEPGQEPTKLVGRTVADVEKELIINTLDQCLGNRTHAATILGISIRTLRNKLNQYRSEGVVIEESAHTPQKTG